MVLPSSPRCEFCGAVNQANVPLCIACNHPLIIFPVPISLQFGTNTLFNGRYLIMSKVGTGGFGSVYKARDTRNGGRLVAIKEVCLRGLNPQSMIEVTKAFHREVSWLSKLTHPSLTCVYEHFNNPEYLYLVMEFIEGETLEEYQNRVEGRRVPLSEVLNIGIQLCIVLHYLHMQQPPIVFRDLKPANIMRTPTGRLYLIDFGIARHFKPGKARDTVALGSLGYAAPEQYGKAQTTPRADIYSLGAVLHQLLTTNDPSEAPFHFTPLRVNSYSSLSDLCMLIERMVDMDVNKRPASASLVKQELQRIANVWKAAIMHFWYPGPQHTNRPQAATGSYIEGYRAVNNPL